MSNLPFDPLLVSIASPLALAVAIALGLPKRWSLRLGYVAFAIPLLLALHVWWHFNDMPPESHGYAFLRSYSTGLDAYGIHLTLGLNGISLPLFVLAAVVGFAAGLYAIQSGAERLKIYLMLLLIMQGGLLGVFASVDVFFFY
ncbi:MAG TPA: NADH-quinone oxidoreductase subunit M, partial [Opitutus sp.]|nr:NADH-quinone oxidoreductase subunit M [Opitutus sp.]